MLLARRPDEKQLDSWRRGIVLEDGDKAMPAQVNLLSTSGKGAWVRVIMGEGKKRQIRETGRLLGLPVVKIIRLRIGTLKLGNLKPNQWRYLTSDEIAELKGEEIAPKPPVRHNRRPAPKPVSKDKPKRPPAKRTGKPFKKSAY